MEKRYAILLVRVSTSQQDYEAQILDLKKYGKSLGFTDFHVIETKETAFADLEQKIGTNEMFDYIKKHPQFNTVLMTEISRFGRRESVLHNLKEQCVSKQIQVYIKDLGFKLLDESGKISEIASLTFTLYGHIAESEMKQKIIRFKRRKTELMEKGLSIGGKLLFGYDRFMTDDKKNTLIVNEEQASIIRTIFNWYQNGLDNLKNPSIRRISIECIKRGFHKYTHRKRNVNKLLKEEAYTGEKITNNKRKNPKFGIVQNEPKFLVSNNKIKYPVIIDKETFNLIQDKLKSNVINGDKDTKHTSILSKLINCPACGRKLGANYRIRDGASKNSYRCSSRTDSRPCTSQSKSISMDLMDSAVWALIKEDLPALSKKINELNPNQYLLDLDTHLNNFNERENEIEREISENVQVIESFSRSKHPNVIELIKNTGKKIDKLENELNKIAQEKARIESDKLLIHNNQEDVEAVIKDNLLTIEKSKELLKKYINMFVDSINILEHNVRYTILEVILKDYTISKDYLDYFGDNFPIKLEIDYIILDKRVTRQIKMAYLKSQSSKRDIKNYRELNYNQIIPRAKKEIDANNYDLSKPIKFNKLTLN